MTTMMMRLSQQPLSLKEGSLGTEFPPLLESIMTKMLATNPADRYQNLSLAVKDLMQLQQNDHHGTEVQSTPPPPKKRLQISRQTLIVIAVAAVSCLVTAIIDRALLLKPDNSPEPAPATISSIPKESKLYPTVEIITEPNGVKWQQFHFPQNIGKVVVNQKIVDAKDDVRLPIGQPLDLRIDNEFARDPNLLSNLTNVSFGNLDFGGNSFLTNQMIAILEKIRNVTKVRLSGYEVTSLKSLYHNPTLTSMIICNTNISASEVLNLDRLLELRLLWFGPMRDAAQVLRKLRSSNKLQKILYNGGSIHSKAEMGFKPVDLDQLSKLTRLEFLHIVECRTFNDEDLKKLVPMIGLRELSIKDCAVTAKSLPTILRFNNLTVISLSTTGWTPEEREALEQQLQKRNCQVRFEKSTLERSHENRNYALEPGQLISPGN